MRALLGGTAATIATLATGALLVAAPSSTALTDATTGHATYHPWAKVTAKDQVFKSGCHRYKYHYKVTAPNSHWEIVIVLKNPGHQEIANAEFDSAVDPAQANGYWYLCRPQSQYGRFSMHPQVSYTKTEFEPQPISGNVRPTSFNLTRPPRHHRR